MNQLLLAHAGEAHSEVAAKDPETTAAEATGSHANTETTQAHTSTASDVHAEATGIAALGINPGAFIIQLITFVIVFMLLKKFAFGPIVRKLEERRKVIDDGVKMGQRMQKEREKLDEEVAAAMRDARHEADKIIATGHKEAREVIREAEKAAHTRAEAILADAEARIHEDTASAKRKLEKDIVGLVSEATEAIVGEKVDAKKDAAIIDKALKGRK